MESMPQICTTLLPTELQYHLFSAQPLHLPYLGWVDIFCELLPSPSNFSALNCTILSRPSGYRKVN